MKAVIRLHCGAETRELWINWTLCSLSRFLLRMSSLEERKRSEWRVWYWRECKERSRRRRS